MESQPRKVVRISLKKVIGLIVIFCILCFIAALAVDNSNRHQPIQLNSSEIPSVTSSPAGYPTMRDYDHSYGGQPDITDSREFLKVSYNGQIKTRDVKDVVKDVKGAIREVEGRIDSEHSSPKNGYVSFVVPKSKFENFRSEIESITHAKLYTESISSQNLLDEKQGIEQNMNAATTSLAMLEQQKKTLDANHTQKIASIKRNITSVQNELSSVRQAMNSTQDESERARFQGDESSLIYKEAAFQNDLSAENKSYTSQNQILISQIDQAKKTVDGVIKIDNQFTNNIETVNGYVTVQWISLWDLAVIFSPVHPILVIIVLVVAAILFLNRKGYIPKVEFV